MFPLPFIVILVNVVQLLLVLRLGELEPIRAPVEGVDVRDEYVDASHASHRLHVELPPRGEEGVPNGVVPVELEGASAGEGHQSMADRLGQHVRADVGDGGERPHQARDDYLCYIAIEQTLRRQTRGVVACD